MTDNPVDAYLRTLSKGSQEKMRLVLRRLYRIILTNADPNQPSRSLPGDEYVIDWPTQMTPKAVGTLRMVLTEVYQSPAPVNVMLAAIKGVIKACFQMELIDSKHYELVMLVKGVKDVDAPLRGRHITDEEIEQTIRHLALDRLPDGKAARRALRDSAVLALMLTTGLRRAEVAALRLQDYNHSTGELRVVRGKGSKSRTVFVPAAARTYMAPWLKVRGRTPGGLFVAVLKNGAIPHYKNVTAQAVYGWFVGRMKEAGITDVTPHDARRTFVGNILELSGNDLVVSQQLTGHKDFETLMRYNRKKNSAAQELAERQKLPQLIPPHTQDEPTDE